MTIQQELKGNIKGRRMKRKMKQMPFPNDYGPQRQKAYNVNFKYGAQSDLNLH